MIRWLKAFLFDQAAFIRLARALIFVLGAALHNGLIPGLNGAAEWWIGPVVSAAALLIAAGDRTPAELKELAEDLRAGKEAAEK